jgi:hypothetical protein
VSTREEENRAAFQNGLDALFAERRRERERHPTEEQRDQRALADDRGVVRCPSRVELAIAAVVGLACAPLYGLLSLPVYFVTSSVLQEFFPTRARLLLAADGAAAVAVTLLTLIPKFRRRGPDAVLVRFDPRRKKHELIGMSFAFIFGLFAQAIALSI